MDYKLFTDFITLQALLKDTGIIKSGGAIKAFLAENTVLVNGEDEKRRGKKLRIGDKIDLTDLEQTIVIVAPTAFEIAEHELDIAEKKRIAELVKKMNQATKKQQARPKKSAQSKKHYPEKNKNTAVNRTQTYRKVDNPVKPAVRFPGVDLCGLNALS
ncbi:MULTISPECIES: S4 domain-containing protein YaaA [unclassified Streptococcus]|uniref:S4 domain-containing protein YaaA n=1 Tax=unclassified Streptococcus TaxID=2608887 RepID=UPI00359DD12C